MHISIVKAEILYFLGLDLLLLGLGLEKGVGLDTYKTIFMWVLTAAVAKQISVWTFNPEVASTIPARGKFFIYIIEEHPHNDIVTLKS